LSDALRRGKICPERFLIFGAFLMKARRSAARGPLLTFALMIGSVLAVVGVSRYFDSHQKTTGQNVSVSASSSPAQNTQQ
jgi:hypothetical protein